MDVRTEHLVFARAVGQVILSYLLSVYFKARLLEFSYREGFIVFARASTGTIYYFLLNYGIKLLTLSRVAFLQNTSPIFSAFIAFIFLKERLSKYEIIAMVICIIGVLFVLQPFGQSDPNTSQTLFGSAIVLLSALINGTN